MSHCFHKNTRESWGLLPTCYEDCWGEHNVELRYCLDCDKDLYLAGNWPNERWLTEQGWWKAERGVYLNSKSRLIDCRALDGEQA
ncbi:MAG: hypothetical protein ACR2IJ_02375 [Fluviibacter sp.]